MALGLCTEINISTCIGSQGAECVKRGEPPSFLQNSWPPATALSQHLANGNLSVCVAKVSKQKPRRVNWLPLHSFYVNQQLYDLGITTERGIEEAIEEIDTTFDLVMIAERMGESLVLLADLSIDMPGPLEAVGGCLKET